MGNRLIATETTLQKFDCCPQKPLWNKESNKSNRSNNIYKIKTIREVREIPTRLIRLMCICIRTREKVLQGGLNTNDGSAD